MAINATTLAAGTGITIANVQQKSAATAVPPKIIVFATYLPAKTGVVPLVPILTTSPEDTADRNGAGSMMHRLVLQAFAGSAGAVPIYEMPQAEAGGAAAGVGEVDFTLTPVVAAGTLHMYLGGIYVPVAVTAAMTEEALVDACVAAATANTALPVTLAKHAVTFELDITAKSLGLWGNEITIAFNLVAGQAFPSGIAVSVTDMASGAGVPVMATALAALGTGDSANADFYTDGIHGYGTDTTTSAAILAYIGATDSAVGCYLPTVTRPFYFMTGDTVSGSSGLAAITAITDVNLTNRSFSVTSFPGEYQPASELAANAVGIAARIYGDKSAQNYIDQVMPGITPYSVTADRWTDSHTTRDVAVKSGIGTSQVKGGALTIQNLVTMSRPASVPVSSNIYRSLVNIRKTMNIIYNCRVNFEQSKWKGIAIVEDVAKVSPSQRSIARDIDAVRADLVALIESFTGNAWLFSSSYPIEKLAETGAISLRGDGTGFDWNLKLIYSGAGGVIDGDIEADISLAVYTT